ncbi:MAG: triose-phosphate isomerase [Desulfobacteraceae bacterium]
MKAKEKRVPLIAGNWKMHKTLAEATALAQEVRDKMTTPAAAEVVLAPPFTALAAVHQVLAGSAVKLAGQDTCWEMEGAFTGAISPLMLRDVGCQYVIIGHSERRQYFGETNDTVNRKIKAALSAGLSPIVCIGETLAEREAEQTLARISEQVQEGLAGLTTDQIEPLVVAYEPIWAIGTGRTATPEQAQEVHAFIRQQLRDRFGDEAADSRRLLYGGSVTPENISELIREPDIDGALVGGASLKAQAFLTITAWGH